VQKIKNVCHLPYNFQTLKNQNKRDLLSEENPLFFSRCKINKHFDRKIV